MNQLKLRRSIKRKKPEFIQQGGRNLVRLKKSWKHPRGKHSKLREHKKAKGFAPMPGYGSPASVRGLHPSGFQEVMVSNVNDLQKIMPEKQACRICASVGRKKRMEIMKKSAEMKIKVLNPLVIEEKKA
jgi:large subunit ribosomal protein L32e